MTPPLQRVSLIVPAPFDTVSGGYGYDRRIVAELRTAGRMVDVIESPGRFPVPDDAARAAVRAVWARRDPSSPMVIDGLALAAFDGLEAEFGPTGPIGLIHHPLSLETGLDRPDQSLLADSERRLLPRLARVMVTSPTTARTLTDQFAVPAGRIHTIVPGTDDGPRCPGSGGAACHILSIGTLIPRKGHDVLLRTLAVLSDLDWHCVIVGSPDRDASHARCLVDLARRLGIADRVRFAGELVGDALDAVWRSADLFALATRYEGYGMAIAEALKRGLPVIVTDGGAAGALVPDDAGFVCPVGQPESLARAARILIADRASRARMAERAWQAGKTLPSWRQQAVLFAAVLA